MSPSGGTTLHSTMGCGIPNLVSDFERMWSKANEPKLKALQVLVVDELSMVSADMFEALAVRERGREGE